VFDAQHPDGHFKIQERHISALNAEIKILEGTSSPQLTVLKQERRQLSEALQLWLFRQYRMLNARGEAKDLVEIWRDYHSSPRIQQRFPLPPGGSGDCCAPKLLQYAYAHNLRPIVMAEFWYGESPHGEIRHHRQFYPACRGKCLPILTFMLQGLNVASSKPSHQPLFPEVLYKDESVLVIVKPSGLLSVPGRTVASSVQSLLTEHYGRLFMPHRLDMDTSGLMVVARTEQAYQHLQQQFYARTIYKKYVALLNGPASHEGRILQPGDHGTITLSLRPDPLDRPRQVVDPLHGKQAITDYKVLSLPSGATFGFDNPCTLVSLIPHTGRTHQLRMHCAHPDGLNAPIKGDNLYGTKDRRLFLHAEELAFCHPLTLEHMHFKYEVDW
jgi:tRNA pseudouridine32 synthase/23S rRNA pseudouridine746 synthase